MIRRNHLKPEISQAPIHLTATQAFWLLWEGHLRGRPSGNTYQPNRRALEHSFGMVHIHLILGYEFARHRQNRIRGEGGFQSVKIGTVYQDHGLMRLMYSKIREWKRNKATIDGVYLGDVMLPDFFPTDGIKRVKPPKRKVIFTPGDFLELCQSATPRLRRTMEALLDIDVRQGDLRRFRVSNYNPYTDQVEWVQSKTGKENCVPVTNRVRQHFIDAREKGWEFVYDLTNLAAEFREARHAARVWHLTLRDIRKTSYNAALRYTGSHHLAGMLAGHTSSRTGIEHYEIEFREDLKPVVQHLEETFRSN
jgi:hypothetical protein